MTLSMRECAPDLQALNDVDARAARECSRRIVAREYEYEQCRKLAINPGSSDSQRLEATLLDTRGACLP